MTDRERAFADVGLEYSEGIEDAAVVELPTGREVRKNAEGTWDVQPWCDNYWLTFDDLLDAVRCGIRPPG